MCTLRESPGLNETQALSRGWAAGASRLGRVLWFVKTTNCNSQFLGKNRLPLSKVLHNHGTAVQVRCMFVDFQTKENSFS